MARNAEPKMPGEDSGQVMFGHHVVTLIDFLGQRSGLAKWDFLPETEHDQQRFIAAVQETFGKITKWRGWFEKNFNIWLKARRPPEWLTEAVPDGGRAYREFADTSLDFMHFSDTIVIYSPVVNRYGHANVGTIMSHVHTCGTLMLEALNQNTVFRGAIEIGMAGQPETTTTKGTPTNAGRWSTNDTRNHKGDWTTRSRTVFFTTRWLSFRCTSGSVFDSRFHRVDSHLVTAKTGGSR